MNIFRTSSYKSLTLGDKGEPALDPNPIFLKGQKGETGFDGSPGQNGLLGELGPRGPKGDR